MSSLTSNELQLVLSRPHLIAMERQRREADAALQADTEAGRASLANFIKAGWHVLEPSTPLKWNWAIDAMCRMLELVTAGEILRLLVNVPPGMMKSLILNVFWPAWEWGPKDLAHLRYIGVSHNDTNSTRDNRKMRSLIQSEWYQRRWPIALTKAAEDYFENDKLGFRQAAPAASVTGLRGDRVLIDDPINSEDVNRDGVMQARENWFRETIRNRLNDPEKSAIVVIMQRLHARDTSGIIIDDKFGFKHLCLPMEFESGRRCVVTVDGDEVFRDPRKNDGDLLFPDRFTRQYVDDEKVRLGEFGFAGQMQQRPVPRGGATFRRSYFGQRWHELPEMKFRRIYVDTAQKIKQQNDFTVFECWGVGKPDGRAYLCDLLRGKWESPELLKVARLFWRKHQDLNRLVYGALREMKIEDKSSGTGLIQQLRRGDPQRGEPPIPVKEIPRTAGHDKVSRALDVAPYCEAGLVVLPAEAPWLAEFELELFSFPKAAHDDQIDPFCDAIADLCGGPARIMDNLE